MEERINIFMSGLGDYVSKIVTQVEQYLDDNTSISTSDANDIITDMDHLDQHYEAIIAAFDVIDLYPAIHINQITQLIRNLETYTGENYYSSIFEYFDLVLSKIFEIHSISPIALNDQVQLNNYTFEEINNKVCESYFVDFIGSAPPVPNPTSPEETNGDVLIFDFTNKMKFKVFIEANFNESNIDILFRFLDKLDIEGNYLSSTKQFVIYHKPTAATSTITDNWIQGYLQLRILKNGETIVTPHQYTAPPTINPTFSYSSTIEYQQFFDFLEILSEYNSQKYILDKYLKLYHVIEGFVSRVQICILENSAHGNMFSLRDFKRLYKNLNESGGKLLNKFFISIFPLLYSPGIRFSNQLHSEWNALTTAPADVIEINNTLDKLGLNLTCTQISNSFTPEKFGKIIYSFRNTIVHNNETEFHLNSCNLNSEPGALKLLNYLLPAMERIVFHLMMNDVLIHYSHEQLKLFDK